MRRPTKCPICGNKIVRVTNAVTKNSYFKCSNEECLFVLGEEYTDAEFSLQGQTLKTTCLKCHKPLTIVNGPHGLYPRCTNCACDFEPTLYNGKMYSKWVNARRNSAKEEIENLITSFNVNNADDELYDFETFIASTQATENTSNIKSEETIKTKILKTLREDITKAMEATEISKALGIKVSSVRIKLLKLKSQKLIKIVGYKENPIGNHTIMYQVPESSLPELPIYKKEDGYNTIISFSKENADRYGSQNEIKKILVKYLLEHNIKPVLFNSLKGICYGYQTSLMEKIINEQVISTPLQITGNTTKCTEKSCAIKILELFNKNKRIPYTTSEISKKINIDKDSLKTTMRKLRETKKIKVVGWDFSGGQKGAIALKYQVLNSPLPKFKTTVDNNLYTTFKQFYDKKLKGKRGKRGMSFADSLKAITDLPIIPLIINHRAYVGYSIADLKETFKDYLNPTTSIKKVRKVVKKPMDIDVEAALIVSQENQVDTQNKVYNPIKKKSILSSLTSLFKKKEKVRS